MPTPSSMDSMGTPNTNTTPTTTSTSSNTNGSNNGNYQTNNNDPKLSFDSYFQPLPGEMQPWLDSSTGAGAGGVGGAGDYWSAVNDFELLNDWNWFAGAQEGVNAAFVNE